MKVLTPIGSLQKNLVGFACLGLSFFLGTKFSTNPTESRASSPGHSVKVEEEVPAPSPPPVQDDRQQAQTHIETREDGTHVLWIKSNHPEYVTQYLFAVNGSLTNLWVHRTNAQGKILGSKFCDSHGNEMFKIRYGYTKQDQVLVEEQIFDSRNKHFDANHQEKPVARLIHMNPSGNEQKPICVKLVPMELPAELESGLRNPLGIGEEE